MWGRLNENVNDISIFLFQAKKPLGGVKDNGADGIYFQFFADRAHFYLWEYFRWSSKKIVLYFVLTWLEKLTSLRYFFLSNHQCVSKLSRADVKDSSLTCICYRKDLTSICTQFLPAGALIIDLRIRIVLICTEYVLVETYFYWHLYLVSFILSFCSLFNPPRNNNHETLRCRHSCR